MSKISKPTREIYADIRSEVINLHYRVLLIRKFFTSEDTVAILNKTAFRFFFVLRNDLLNTVVISICRITDSPITFKHRNVSFQQLIDSLDPKDFNPLITTLSGILAEIKLKIRRIEYWRDKWVAHRDFDVVKGDEPMVSISLPEVDETLILIGKFINKFEEVCQDIPEEINLHGRNLSHDEIELMGRLKIFPPFPYNDFPFEDDASKILNLIKTDYHSA